jgi:phosphatidylserine decarboxylase
MRIDRTGIPFIAGALVPAALFGLARRPLYALPFAALAGFFAFFFRDPERSSPEEAGLVLSPADGRVIVTGEPLPGAPEGVWQQISIFLSPLDVHINRVPVSGHVVRVDYCPGTFLPAYQPEAGANERSEVWIQQGANVVVCRQVVGVLARRVVCRLRPGAEVRAGDRFGIMKFGSRMDLFLPPSAKLLTDVGQRVRGGETVVARLAQQEGAD